MFVLPQLAFAAALLASVPGPSAGERFFSDAEKSFFVPEGTETVSFGLASLEVTPRVSLLRRVGVAPVKLVARGGDVVVWGCVEHTCAIRNEIVVRSGTEVEVDLPVWGQAVRLRARADDQERVCCRNPDRALSTVLVAGAPRRTAAINIGPGRDIGFEGVDSLLRERPELLGATDAVLVLDEAAAPDAASRAAFMERGGTWITLRQDATLGAVVRERETVHGAGSLLELAGPPDADAIALAVAAHVPSLSVTPMASYNPGHEPVARAASVALAQGPPAALVLLVLVAAFVGAGASMWRARAGQWRSALARAAVVFAIAGAALFTLKPLFVAREVRARMVAWVGPLGATEIGVDAARPRSGSAKVLLETPVAALGAQTLAGNMSPVVVHLEPGARRAEVVAHADSGAGLAWVRPNAHAGAVRVIDGALHNGLEEPVAFWVRANGSFAGGPVMPGGTARFQDVPERVNAWESFTREGIAPHEERLMREVLDLCRQDGGTECGAALVRRPTETLVIEVRGW